MTATWRLPDALPQAALLLLAACFGVLAGIEPKFAVAGAIGLGFVILTLGNVTFGLCIFAIVAFVDVLPDFGAAFFSFAKITGALLAASWAATTAVRGRREKGFVSTHPFVSYAIALFLGWGAASLLWAEQASYGAAVLPRYALNLVLFVIVYAAVRNRRQAMMVAGAYVGGATIAGLFAVLGPAGWAGPNEVARATGTVGDANELAAVLIPGVILALALGLTVKRSPLARLAGFGAGGICLLALLLTLSRGGLVGLGCALLATIVFGGRWRPLAAVAAVAVALLTVGYFTFVASPVERQRVTEVQGGTGRADIWTVGMRMVRNHPVTGVGLGNFQTSSVHYLLEPGALPRSEFIVDEPKVAHNTFLQVLAELGVVGCVLFLGIIGFSLSAALRAAWAFAAKRDRGMEMVARGVLISLVGLLGADFFISANFSKQLWLMLGLGPALLVIARRNGEDEETEGESAGPARWPPPARLEPARTGA